MPKQKYVENVFVQCPYYKYERQCVIYCEGHEENCSIHMAFASSTQRKQYEKQFNSYQIRQYRKQEQERKKKFSYEHPDIVKKYLDDGPCKGCEFELLCDVPCGAYYHWWDARMAVLKKKYEME